MRWLLGRLFLFPTLFLHLLICRVFRYFHWWDEVAPRLILGALPLAGQVPQLKSLGVRAVVNLCEEWAGPEAAYQAEGITQLRLPTVDYTCPSYADLERGVQFIKGVLTQGHRVYVHCKAGRGRGAALALCWLIEAYGMSPQEAQLLLQERRRQVNHRLYRCPPVQEFFHRRVGGSAALGGCNGL